MSWWREWVEIKLKRWGWYLVLLKGRFFKVKLLYFKKGGEISYQRHKNRAETWCFLFGSGSMTLEYPLISGQNVCKVKGGDTSYVSVDTWHHYKADKRTLVLEIQTGICEEEDIERV